MKAIIIQSHNIAIIELFIRPLIYFGNKISQLQLFELRSQLKKLLYLLHAMNLNLLKWLNLPGVPGWFLFFLSDCCSGCELTIKKQVFNDLKVLYMSNSIHPNIIKTKATIESVQIQNISMKLENR